jgi:thymidine kinase
MAKLNFRFSAMNAGKSTYLLQAAYNYNETGQKVALYTAGVDDRYGVGKITSRLGLSRDAVIFNADTDFSKELPSDIACVFIDEAQFLAPVQVTQLHAWAHRSNIPVICFGIRSDFKGQPFPGAAQLLALADDLEEIKTICACSRKATMNMRTDENGVRVVEGEQVLVGGNNHYRQVCARCFYG